MDFQNAQLSSTSFLTSFYSYKVQRNLEGQGAPGLGCREVATCDRGGWGGEEVMETAKQEDNLVLQKLLETWCTGPCTRGLKNKSVPVITGLLPAQSRPRNESKLWSL